MIRTIKLRRNIAFSGKLVMQRGEELTDIDLGVRVRKHLVANGSAVMMTAEIAPEAKVAPGPSEDKAVEPSENKSAARPPGASRRRRPKSGR